MPFYAGFDLGGTELKYGLLDDRNALVFKSSAVTPSDIGKLVESFEELWEALKKREKREIRAAGFGIPGIFSLKEKKTIQSPNIPQLNNFDLHKAISRFIKVPFWLDNDANMAAYGEYRCGAGKGIRDLILLTLGTGVGSGIIIDGELLHGQCGFAAEMGHIVVNPEGEKCNCGSHGCLETEASAGAIVRNYGRFVPTDDPLTAKEIAARAKRGDQAAIQSFERAGYYLGIGLATAINMLNPKKILLGGGVMTSGELLLPRTIEEARRRSYRASFGCCSIEKASLENDAGFMGAASWAKDRLSKQKRGAKTRGLF